MITPADALSAGGPLARKIPGFATRVQQQAMAERVAQALDQNEELICEAGPGIGKTFAYLVPVLLSGKKTIISTGTKALQDQLYRRDLPLVREALQRPIRVALLKGRSNYLCLHRLAQMARDAGSHSRAVQSVMVKIAAWQRRTVTGEISELAGVPEDSPAWPWVT